MAFNGSILRGSIAINIYVIMYFYFICVSYCILYQLLQHVYTLNVKEDTHIFMSIYAKDTQYNYIYT